MEPDKNESVTRKIGARPLTEAEVKLILPTYEKIKDQIHEIRSEGKQFVEDSKKDKKSKEDSKKGEKSKEYMQKTNNIGILGERGTGKTSVLKTIIGYLQAEDGRESKIKDIILPLIVPENMSESTNLMATILGLFKTEVDKIVKESKKDSANCWKQPENTVEKEYKKLVEKYCYIQKEYRDILIGQYTTENAYVEKSSVIFNSDIEFINCFNLFIETLLKEDLYKDETLIFFFVDDIDLSTHRCTDVVKTLLSYISHPRIVTFISGDLGTFKEALTIDFLRQEHALSGDLLNIKFLGDKQDSLLKRKQELAYEYLKKVIPPVYRHHVKKWGLEDRGNYFIEDNSEKGQGGTVKKLVDLLSETFGIFNCGDYFQYYDYSGLEEISETNGNIIEREKRGELKIIPELFHLFDSTSRGLNNVYNALLDTKRVLSLKNVNNKHFEAIRIFLDRVVASNVKLSNYTTQLLEDTIQFGNDFKTTNIRCDNFMNIVYLGDNKEEDSQVRFVLFVFLDFSIRILHKNTLLNTEEYNNVRKLALLDLVNNPIISGSKMQVENNKILSCDNDIKRLINNNFFTIENGFGNSEDNIWSNNQENIINIMFSADFIYSIRFYQYIIRENCNFINILSDIGNKKSKEDISVEMNFRNIKYNKTLEYIYLTFFHKESTERQEEVKNIECNWGSIKNVLKSINESLSATAIENIIIPIFGNVFLVNQTENLVIQEIQNSGFEILFDKNQTIYEMFTENSRIKDIKDSIGIIDDLYKKNTDERHRIILKKRESNNADELNGKLNKVNIDRDELRKKGKKLNENLEIIRKEQKKNQWFIQILVKNFLYNNFEKSLFLKDKLINFPKKKEGYLGSCDSDKKRYECIRNLENENLWNTAPAEIVKDFINKKINDIFKSIDDTLYWGIDFNSFQLQFKEFDDFIKKNGINRISRQMFNEIRGLFIKDNNGDFIFNYIGIQDYMKIYDAISFLLDNKRSWFVHEEAKRMLVALKKLPFVLLEKQEEGNWVELDGNWSTKKEIWTESKEIWSELNPWFHCYASYRMAEKGMDMLYKQGSYLSNLSEIISKFIDSLDKQELKNFKGKIKGSKLKSSINFEDIESLFGSRGGDASDAE